jgi:hypothetical protein
MTYYSSSLLPRSHNVALRRGDRNGAVLRIAPQ